MPYKDPEKRRANRRVYRENNRQRFRERAKEYYYRNRQAIAERHRTRYRDITRNRSLVKRFGITSLQYEELHKFQGGVCAICFKTDHKILSVDHDHSTGRVRGLLCSKCNTALGLLDDLPERLRFAASYLERPPAIIVTSVPPS